MTDRKHPEDLTPDERARWEALPSERAAPPALEERVVRALRRERLLRPASRPNWTRLPWAIAAAIAIFALGVAAGTQLGAGPVVSPAAPTGEDPTLRLQQAGSAYIHALAQVEPSAGATSDSTAVTQVALRTFEGAAREITRLTGGGALPAIPRDGNVVWF